MFRKKVSVLFLTVLLFVTLGAGSAYAAFQFDVGLTYPFLIGGISSDGDVEGFNMTDFNTAEGGAFLLFPDLQMHYYWEVGPVKLGPGLRVVPLILINAAYPMVSAEMDFLFLRFNFSFGGGVFAIFGLLNTVQFANLWFPELSVAVKPADWVNFGVAVTGLVAPDLTTEGMGAAMSAFVRFSFTAGKN